MTHKQFQEWIREAYPDVKGYSNNTVFSNNRKVIQVSLVKNGKFEFPEYGSIVFTDDDVIAYTTMLWGGPQVDWYRWKSKNYPAEVVKQKTQESQVRPVISTKVVPETTFKEKTTLPEKYTKDSVLEFLKVKFPGVSVTKLSSGSIMYGEDGIILGTYGVTPSPTKTHIFIPYSHTSKMSKFLKEL